MSPSARVIAIVTATLGADCALGAEPPTQSATVLGGTNPPLAYGAAALEKGQVADGIRLTLEGLQLPGSKQDKAAGHSNLCAGYAMLKNWDEALRHCNAALALDGRNWRTFNNRAHVYVSKGDYEKAMNDIRAGLQIAPNAPVLRESLRVIEENRRLLTSRSRTAIRPP